MEKIAILGPKGTFTEKATFEYMSRQGVELETRYFGSMRRTIQAIGTTCQYGVLPIENTLDGFVSIILDLLSASDLKIVYDILLPIKFAFVANVHDMAQVKKVYAQFKSHNQCLDFMEQLGDVEVITTGSNSVSYKKVQEKVPGEGALIPYHLIPRDNPFDLLIDNVTDARDNQTRFVVVGTELNNEEVGPSPWKTLFVVQGDSDHPGLLWEILGMFAESQINLNSIYSRPTKTGLGNYNFFIDVDGCYRRDTHVKQAFEKIHKKFRIKILGSYYRI